MSHNAYQIAGSRAGRFSAIAQQGSLLNFKPTYYVDSINGLDTNDGLTADTAFQTITKANATLLAPGESIGFKRGQIFTGQLVPRSGDVTANTIYGSYGSGAYPVIEQNTLTSSLYFFSKNYITVQNLDIRNNLGGSTARGCYMQGANSNITIQSCKISGYDGIGVAGALTNGYFSKLTGVTISRNDIYVYSVGNSNINVTNCNFAKRANINNTSNIVINSNTGQSFNIDTCTGSFEAKYNIFDMNGSTFTAGQHFTDCSFSSSNIDANIVYGRSNTAYYIISSSGLNFNRCVANTGTFGFRNDGADNINFDKCLAINGTGDGFNTTGGCHDITFKYCRASNNGNKNSDSAGDGFTSHDLDYNINILYCISDNNTCSGFALTERSSGLVYGCTCFNNSGDWTQEGGVGQYRGGIYIPGDTVNPTTLQGWTVKNCITDGNYPYEVNTNSIHTYNYNSYYSLRTNPFNLDATPMNWTTYNSTQEANSIFQNPNLVNLIPSVEIENAEDLGLSYNDGLDVLTVWGNGTTIPSYATKKQGDNWQVGAFVQ